MNQDFNQNDKQQDTARGQYGNHSPYGQAQNPQGAYTQNPYGQNPYTQNPYGQSPYGQNPYGQNPYGQNPYAQDGQNPYNPYGQFPYVPPQDSKGNTAQTLGIIALISIMFCQLLSIILGAIAMANAKQSAMMLQYESSPAKNGRVCGLVAVIIGALSTGATLLFTVFIIIGSML